MKRTHSEEEMNRCPPIKKQRVDNEGQQARNIRSHSAERTFQLLHQGANQQNYCHESFKESALSRSHCFYCPLPTYGAASPCYYCERMLCKHCVNVCYKCQENFCKSCSFPQFSTEYSICYGCYR